MTEITKERAVISLYRYFAWADYMRRHHEEVRVRDEALRATGKHDDLPYDEMMRAEMYMCFWFASLYSVIDGWRRLKLEVPEIAKLLRSPMTERLREFRNAVYHPEAFDDERLAALIKTGEAGAEWVLEVTTAFRRFFRSIGVPDGVVNASE